MAIRLSLQLLPARGSVYLLPLESGVASFKAVTNQMWQKCHGANSERGPERPRSASSHPLGVLLPCEQASAGLTGQDRPRGERGPAKATGPSEPQTYARPVTACGADEPSQLSTAHTAPPQSPEQMNTCFICIMKRHPSGFHRETRAANLSSGGRRLCAS